MPSETLAQYTSSRIKINKSELARNEDSARAQSV